MKFLADMGISPHSVRFLRSLGHEAFHLQELGLERLPDSSILAKAEAEQSVVLTHDLDFGDLLAASRAALPSVIIFRLTDMRPASVNQQLVQVLDQYRAELRQGAILSVTNRRIRVRILPIEK